MKNKIPPTVLIIDVATSHFREPMCLLEVAVILVDCTTLEVLDTHSSICRAPSDTKIPPFHQALLQECSAPDVNSVKAVEGFLLAGEWTRAAAVCNRNLDFDLRVLKQHMPTLERGLPRLQVHLEALELVLGARGVLAFVDDFPRTYRAGDDAIAAYNELCHWATAPRGTK